MDEKKTPEQSSQVSRLKSFTDRFKKKSPEEQANDMTSDSAESSDHQAKAFHNRHKSRDSKTYTNAQGNAHSNPNEGQKNFERRRWQGKNPHAQHNKVQTDESTNGIREVRDVNEKGNLGLHKDLKRGVEANERIQRQSLNAHNKLNLNTKASVRITPLGGLGEIGGNITVIETQDSAIVIDVGMSFPNEDMHGVDILVPDFSYLFAIKDKIAGVIITHAHEDHIGAVPYLFKLLQFPIYGTPLPLGMIGSKFDEHGLKKFRSFFKIVEKRKPIKIGAFEVEWINITHSVLSLIHI